MKVLKVKSKKVEEFTDKEFDKNSQEFDKVTSEREDRMIGEGSKVCVICGKRFDGYGNNAQPVKDGICCDKCNVDKVIPERIKMVKGTKTEGLTKAILKSEIDAAVKDYFDKNYKSDLDPDDELGISLDDIMYSSEVSSGVNYDGDKYTKVEISAELSYDQLYELAKELDKVVAKYDKNAYFDMEEPGIASAYIFKKIKDESVKTESLARWADTNAQEDVVRELEKVANSIGVKVRYGTKVGKYPQTLILDHDYQDNAIRVNSNGSMEIGEVEFGSYSDEDHDFSDFDRDRVISALKSLDENVDESLKTEGRSLQDMNDMFKNAKKIGLKTVGDFKRFLDNEGKDDEDLYDALKRYSKELGDDFEFKDESMKSEGISGTMTPEEIAKKHRVSVDKINGQLKKGIEVEKEHTDNEDEAKRIALDHLFEMPDYYDKLSDMENGSKMQEDTIKKRNGKWVNRGDDGTEHGEFDTKKQADAQRKAMFANGYKGEGYHKSYMPEVGDKVIITDDIGEKGYYEPEEKYNDRKTKEGKVGKITYIGSEYSAADTVAVEFDDGKEFYFRSWQVKPVESESVMESYAKGLVDSYKGESIQTMLVEEYNKTYSELMDTPDNPKHDELGDKCRSIAIYLHENYPEDYKDLRSVPLTKENIMKRVSKLEKKYDTLSLDRLINSVVTKTKDKESDSKIKFKDGTYGSCYKSLYDEIKDIDKEYGGGEFLDKTEFDDKLKELGIEYVTNNEPCEELDESYMSDLSVEVDEAGGNKAYLRQAYQDIKDLENEKKELRYRGTRDGSNFDTEDDLDEAIEEIDKKIESIKTKISIVKKSLESFEDEHVGKSDDDEFTDEWDEEDATEESSVAIEGYSDGIIAQDDEPQFIPDSTSEQEVTKIIDRNDKAVNVNPDDDEFVDLGVGQKSVSLGNEEDSDEFFDEGLFAEDSVVPYEELVNNAKEIMSK